MSMDVTSTEPADLHYLDPPPVLIAGSSEAAIRRADWTIKTSGLRVGARMPLELAQVRIAEQAAATAIWIELDQDCGGPMDDLLAHVSRDVAGGRYAAVVSAPAALLDPVAARLEESAVELLIDASDADRAAALALATADVYRSFAVADIASDQNAERLRQLSDEVSRIASTLARLSANPPSAPRGAEAPRIAEAPPVSADTIRSVIRARRLRARYFSEELFADPAWDMLLDLLQAEIAQLRVPVSSLCIAAAVPATTALRWLKTMVSTGLFIRRADPHDGRRVFVELAPEASHALRSYFAEVGAIAAI
jgi:DNA-binding MarR family transcriptional regulator